MSYRFLLGTRKLHLHLTKFSAKEQNNLTCQTKNSKTLIGLDKVHPVTHLDVTRMEDNSVLISRDYPEGFAPNGEVTLSWSGDYEIPSAAGQSHGDIAHRFEVADLTRYKGWKLKCVSVVPLSASHTYFVRELLGYNVYANRQQIATIQIYCCPLKRIRLLIVIWVNSDSIITGKAELPIEDLAYFALQEK